MVCGCDLPERVSDPQCGFRFPSTRVLRYVNLNHTCDQKNVVVGVNDGGALSEKRQLLASTED